MPDAMPGLAPGIHGNVPSPNGSARRLTTTRLVGTAPAMTAVEAGPSRKFELKPRVTLLSDVLALLAFGGAAPVRLT